MSDNALGLASLILSTNSQPLEDGLKKAENTITAFSAKVTDSFSVISSNPYVAAISAGIGGAIKLWDGFADKAKEVFAGIAEQSQAAMKVGVSTGNFQSLLAGSKADAETLQHSLTHLQTQVAEFGRGGTGASETFERMGISIDQLKGKGADEQFRVIAKSIHDMTNAENQASAAMRVFGRAGAQLLPGMKGDMKAAEDRARALGLVLSDEDASGVKTLQKTWRDTENIIRGIWTKLSVTALPIFQAIATTINNTWEFLRPAVDYSIKVIGGLFKFIRAGFDVVTEIIKPYADAFMSAFGSIGLSSEKMTDIIIEGVRMVVQYYGFWLNMGKTLGIAYLDYVFKPMLGFYKWYLGAMKGQTLALVDFTNFVVKAGQMYVKGFTIPVIEGTTAILKFLSDAMDNVPSVVRKGILGFDQMNDALKATTKVAGDFGKGLSILAKTDLTIDKAMVARAFDAGQKGIDTFKSMIASMEEQLKNVDLSPAGINSFFDRIKAKMKEVTTSVKEDMEKSVEPIAEAITAIKQSAAMVFGSKEAANVVYQASYGGGSQGSDKMLNVLNQSHKTQANTEKNTRGILDALKSKPSLEFGLI